MKNLNTFAADDLSLCRSHSKAVDEHFIDPTTQDDLRRHTEYTNHWIAVSRFERGVHMPTDAPLPPTYDQDLDEWLAERDAAFAQRVREYVGDAPGNVNALAAKPVEQATHSVCIKAHGNLGWKIGEVVAGGPNTFVNTQCWLPCDKDGWVSHTPTADSVCPVPDGVWFEFRVHVGQDAHKGGRGDCNAIKWDSGTSVVAWRPTGAA